MYPLEKDGKYDDGARNVCNRIKLRLTQLGLSMTIDELLAANPNAQSEWLKVKYAVRAEQAEDDVASYLPACSSP